MANVTEKQAEMMVALSHGDFTDDDGEPMAFTANLCRTRSDAAVFGSLLAAGLVDYYGDGTREFAHLTEAGWAIARQW